MQGRLVRPGVLHGDLHQQIPGPGLGIVDGHQPWGSGACVTSSFRAAKQTVAASGRVSGASPGTPADPSRAGGRGDPPRAGAGSKLGKARTATIRTTLINIPARLAFSAGSYTLHLPANSRRERPFMTMFDDIQAPPQAA